MYKSYKIFNANLFANLFNKKLVHSMNTGILNI